MGVLHKTVGARGQARIRRLVGRRDATPARRPSKPEIVGSNPSGPATTISNSLRRFLITRIVLDGRNRKDVRVGAEVNIVLKQDQRTSNLTRGFVKELLTNSEYHPHGIKVRLRDGKVGRVKEILQGPTKE
jgi:uncharacterized repeat protein (TIGR03833 family)